MDEMPRIKEGQQVNETEGQRNTREYAFRTNDGENAARASISHSSLNLEKG